MTHRHRWHISSYSGSPLVFTYRCKCGEEKSRAGTKDETKAFRAYVRKLRGPGIHAVNHAFSKAIKGKHSYEASLVAEKFAKKHPDRVFIVGCDDDYHMSSDIVFVTHEGDKPSFLDGLAGQSRPAFWGTTVYYIGQCEHDVRSFFLYPGHAKSLMDVLEKLTTREAAYTKKRTKRTKKS